MRPYYGPPVDWVVLHKQLLDALTLLLGGVIDGNESSYAIDGGTF